MRRVETGLRNAVRQDDGEPFVDIQTEQFLIAGVGLAHVGEEGNVPERWRDFFKNVARNVNGQRLPAGFVIDAGAHRNGRAQHAVRRRILRARLYVLDTNRLNGRGFAVMEQKQRQPGKRLFD